MALSIRLTSIASLVDPEAIIADIGSDHGLLLAYLLNKQIINKGYATDNKVGPIARLIKQFAIEPRIHVYMADGLDNLASDVNCLIIAGMGANVIETIILRGQKQLANIQSIIISPHNEPQLIRGLMSYLGYYVDDELIVNEKGQFYDVIKFKAGPSSYHPMELMWGPLNLTRRSPVLLDKMRQRINQIKGIIDKVDPYKQQQLLSELKELTNYDQNT